MGGAEKVRADDAVCTDGQHGTTLRAWQVLQIDAPCAGHGPQSTGAGTICRTACLVLLPCMTARSLQLTVLHVPQTSGPRPLALPSATIFRNTHHLKTPTPPPRHTPPTPTNQAYLGRRSWRPRAQC